MRLANNRKRNIPAISPRRKPHGRFTLCVVVNTDKKSEWYGSFSLLVWSRKSSIHGIAVYSVHDGDLMDMVYAPPFPLRSNAFMKFCKAFYIPRTKGKGIKIIKESARKSEIMSAANGLLGKRRIGIRWPLKKEKRYFTKKDILGTLSDYIFGIEQELQ